MDASGKEGRVATTDPGARRATAEQMRRAHILVVNDSPAFLDLTRVLLQRQRYNVTTTNLVTRTHDMIAALGPEAIVVDLAVGEEAVWGLLDRLAAESQTARIPLVLTSIDPALLQRAQGVVHRAGGRFLLARPFHPADLADTIHALVGPA